MKNVPREGSEKNYLPIILVAVIIFKIKLDS